VDGRGPRRAGSYGLGENIVQGAVDPDEFYVHKPTYASGHRAVLRRLLGGKAMKLVFAQGGIGHTTRNIPTPQADREQYCLTDAEILQLAGQAITIENHYGRSMDTEWAKDGTDGQLYLVQAWPETVASRRAAAVLESYLLDGRGEVLAEGRAVGEKIAAGRPHRQEPVGTGRVLARWGTGGRRHGAGNATTAIPAGQPVTVSCAEGETGRVSAANCPSASSAPRSPACRARRPGS